MGTLNVTLNEEQHAQVKEALQLADTLVTAVISGRAGQQRAALDVARAIADLKRAKVIYDK